MEGIQSEGRTGRFLESLLKFKEQERETKEKKERSFSCPVPDQYFVASNSESCGSDRVSEQWEMRQNGIKILTKLPLIVNYHHGL